MMQMAQDKHGQARGGGAKGERAPRSAHLTSGTGEGTPSPNVYLGGGVLIVHECNEYTQYLTIDDLGSALTYVLSKIWTTSKNLLNTHTDTNTVPTQVLIGKEGSSGKIIPLA